MKPISGKQERGQVMDTERIGTQEGSTGPYLGLMLGNIEGKRRSGQQRMKWLDSITDSMDMNLSKVQEIVEDREAWCAAIHRYTN